MVKGCQKKIIVVTDTGSRYFDSAYFILKKELPPCSQNDMMSEARRMLDACSMERALELNGGKKKFARRSGSGTAGGLGSVIAFFSGAAAVGLLAGLIALAANFLL
ncbi:MAG: hypothetical protein IJ493_12845 [Clostridia bacterium]|nr:hypothetical protein [Clostridia bacterium]